MVNKVFFQQLLNQIPGWMVSGCTPSRPQHPVHLLADRRDTLIILRRLLQLHSLHHVHVPRVFWKKTIFFQLHGNYQWRVTVEKNRWNTEPRIEQEITTNPQTYQRTRLRRRDVRVARLWLGWWPPELLRTTLSTADRCPLSAPASHPDPSNRRISSAWDRTEILNSSLLTYKQYSSLIKANPLTFEDHCILQVVCFGISKTVKKELFLRMFAIW